MKQIADDEALKRCFEAVLGLRRNYGRAKSELEFTILFYLFIGRR